MSPTNTTDLIEVDLDDLIESAVNELPNESPTSISVPDIEAQAQYPEPKGD